MYDELEVALCGMLANELNESVCKRFNILAVEIRCGLVKREQTALHAEHFGERQTDEQRGEHLLARTTASAHVHLLAALHHHLLSNIIIQHYFLIVTEIECDDKFEHSLTG